jgi:ATP-dependent RNA helicase DDX27
MAPNIDDDFVFTISDHDDVSDDGGAEEAAASAKLSGRGKKRKYTEDPDLNVKPKEVASKKAKKDKKKGKKGKPEPAAEEESDNEIAAPGEDVEQNDDIASDFEFAVGDIDTGFVEEFDGWGNQEGTVGREQTAEKKSNAVDVDDIIERRRSKKKAEAEDLSDEEEEPVEADFSGFGDDDELLADDAFGMGAGSDSEEEADEDDEAPVATKGGLANDSGQEDEASDDDEAAAVPHPMDLEGAESDDEAKSDVEDAVEAKKAAAFFAPEEDASSKKKGAKSGASFHSMALSRPIQKGLAAVGFTEPTPIQAKTIPIAMQGKDVVGGAETGSGKTAAFLIPILERLLYRPKKVPTTRVAIFMPTRELAVQCFNVATKLASFTDITFALLAGGFSSREQEAMLKTRPDVVIATPGRFIDHMHNTAAFQVEHLEILVLDEADRMLEEGFESQLNEILTTIPKSRQTMLFSATMTSTVDKLIRIGMDKPVRLMVDAKKHTVAGLTQEFIRLRQGKEDKRLAYLMYICEKIYTERVIIFFRQKKEAHKVRVVFALCGMKASELHGNMSQEQVSVMHKKAFLQLLTCTAYSIRGSVPVWKVIVSTRYRRRLAWSRYQERINRHQLRSPSNARHLHASCRPHRSCRTKRSRMHTCRRTRPQSRQAGCQGIQRPRRQSRQPTSPRRRDRALDGQAPRPRGRDRGSPQRRKRGADTEHHGARPQARNESHRARGRDQVATEARLVRVREGEDGGAGEGRCCAQCACGWVCQAEEEETERQGQEEAGGEGCEVGW